MMFRKEDILARVPDLKGFVESQGIKLIRSGSEWKMLCPFHDDHNPSMGFNPNKGDAGLFKCFSCGQSADLFSFFGMLHGIDDFPGQIELLADLLGMTGSGKAHAKIKPQQREVVKKSTPQPTQMTAREVLAYYRNYKEQSVDSREYSESLGYHPKAIELMQGIVAPAWDNGPISMIVPQRDATGMLSSLRFRSFEPKRRWSLDEKEMIGGERVQTKRTAAGLMAHESFFNPEIYINEIPTVVIEGETDLGAAFTMMLLEFGDDPVEWPVRWCALPGVNSCHEMVCKCRHGSTVLMFMDLDQGGIRSVFDHRPLKRVEGGKKMMPDHTKPVRQGLMSKFRQVAGVKTVLAAFPESTKDGLGGDTPDLRDMVRNGMRWYDFRMQFARTGTSDPRGIKMKRRLATNVSSTDA